MQRLRLTTHLSRRAPERGRVRRRADQGCGRGQVDCKSAHPGTSQGRDRRREDADGVYPGKSGHEWWSPIKELRRQAASAFPSDLPDAVRRSYPCDHALEHHCWLRVCTGRA